MDYNYILFSPYMRTGPRLPTVYDTYTYTSIVARCQARRTMSTPHRASSSLGGLDNDVLVLLLSILSTSVVTSQFLTGTK